MASYLYTRCNCNTSHRRASLYNSSPTSSFRLFPARANRLLRKNLRVHFSTTLRLIQSRNFRVIARVDLLFFLLLLLLSVSFVRNRNRLSSTVRPFFLFLNTVSLIVPPLIFQTGRESLKPVLSLSFFAEPFVALRFFRINRMSDTCLIARGYSKD